jgi:hypothetical protein
VELQPAAVDAMGAVSAESAMGDDGRVPEVSVR